MALIAALLAFFWVLAWVGNPYLDNTKSADDALVPWTAPTLPKPSTTVVLPPPGFPSMEFPPPMPEVPEGQPQPVPTRFGLSYSVPSDSSWYPSNSTVMGWTDDSGDIATYGAVSSYKYGYCPDTRGSTLAEVGVTGRNGVDIDTVAREEVGKAERIFSDDEAGRKPKVAIQGPFVLEVSGRPAVRYTAVVTDIPKKNGCDPSRAHFDIVATPAYATAEVMILMVEHHVGLPMALSSGDVDTIIKSLRKTEE
ncbi:hypothetical protein ACL02S_14750 [Nocardia sp. 004]|uniref:hypothetical protein n=1 Tax=Nocardia sp. 004 TaxID=3385978 RepID=UPI0039A2CA8E